MTRAERAGNRPEGYCRLKFDDELGYWVYIKDNGFRYRAKDLPWPNECRYPYDRRPGSPKEDPSYEPYPLEHLCQALRCSKDEVLKIIGRYGEFYRRKE